MPNGRVGDNPVSDMLAHDKHPFPPDMEAMIKELYQVAPQIQNELGWAPFDWEKGNELEAGRKLLKDLLAKYNAR